VSSSNSILNDLGNIRQIFCSAFSCISEKFQILEKGIEELKSSKENFIYHPGVYVYWHAAVGIFMEEHLNPVIKAQRKG